MEVPNACACFSARAPARIFSSNLSAASISACRALLRILPRLLPGRPPTRARAWLNSMAEVAVGKRLR
eukprot:7372487-Alexandrium_andersonii.AAC.1